MKRAFFSDLSFQSAIYDGEKKRMMVEEPRMILILEIKDGLNSKLKLFDIYEEVCQSWQYDYSFTEKEILWKIKNELKNKTFMLNEDMSLDRNYLSAILSNYFAFDFNPCEFTNCKRTSKHTKWA